MLNFRTILDMLYGEEWDEILKLVPEFQRMEGLWQGVKYHYTDAWTHTKHVVKAVKLLKAKLEGEKVQLDFSPSTESGFRRLVAARELFEPPVSEWLLSRLNSKIDHDVRLWDVVLVAALFHDIGKPDTAEDVGDGIRVHFIGHPEVGARILRSKLIPHELNELWERVIELVELHFILLSGFNYNFPDKRYIPDVPHRPDLRAALIALSIADIVSSRSDHRFDEYMEYLGTVMWFWLYYEKIWDLAQAFLASNRHPEKFHYISEAVREAVRIPASRYDLTLQSIAVERNGRKFSLFRELSLFAEFAVRSPVFITFREGVKFILAMSDKFNGFEKKLPGYKKNPQIQLAVKVVELLRGETRAGDCAECNMTAASITCENGDYEKAAILVELIDSPDSLWKAVRYCGLPWATDILRKRSAFSPGAVQGFSRPRTVSHWLQLTCDSLPFCVWDEGVRKLGNDLVDSPPFSAGKAFGEMIRFYIKLWQCSDMTGWLAEYSSWLLDKIASRTSDMRLRELVTILIASLDGSAWKRSWLMELTVSDAALLASVIRTNPQAVWYAEDEVILKDVLSYDIGKTNRKILQDFLKAKSPCEKVNILLRFSGKEVKIKSLRELREATNSLSNKKGPASLPALLEYYTKRCEKELMKHRQMKNPINIFKQMSKLLISLFSKATANPLSD